MREIITIRRSRDLSSLRSRLIPSTGWMNLSSSFSIVLITCHDPTSRNSSLIFFSHEFKPKSWSSCCSCRIRRERRTLYHGMEIRSQIIKFERRYHLPGAGIFNSFRQEFLMSRFLFSLFCIFIDILLVLGLIFRSCWILSSFSDTSVLSWPWDPFTWSSRCNITKSIRDPISRSAWAKGRLRLPSVSLKKLLLTCTSWKRTMSCTYELCSSNYFPARSCCSWRHPSMRRKRSSRACLNIGYLGPWVLVKIWSACSSRQSCSRLCR